MIDGSLRMSKAIWHRLVPRSANTIKDGKFEWSGEASGGPLPRGGRHRDEVGPQGSQRFPTRGAQKGPCSSTRGASTGERAGHRGKNSHASEKCAPRAIQKIRKGLALANRPTTLVVALLAILAPLVPVDGFSDKAAKIAKNASLSCPGAKPDH